MKIDNMLPLGKLAEQTMGTEAAKPTDAQIEQFQKLLGTSKTEPEGLNMATSLLDSQQRMTQAIVQVDLAAKFGGGFAQSINKLVSMQ
jgi:type III secretion system YscI/HrpB-like protein